MFRNLKNKKYIVSCVLCIAVVTAILFSIIGNLSFQLMERAHSVLVTEEEVLNGASKEQIDNLRYGYNVTSGKALSDFSKGKAILRDIYESGLYQYIDKTDDTGRKMEAKNYIADSAREVASLSGSTLNGGIETKIKIVSMDISTHFKHTTSLKNIYQERYEIYEQIIYRKSYIIQKDDLRNYLEGDFIDALNNIENVDDALKLFDIYGTHIFTGFQYGGLMMITNYQASNSSSNNLNSDSGLETKIGTAIGNMKAGTNFSFALAYTNTENIDTRTSTYNCISYGGKAVTGMTMDQLFTYNDSYFDGKGNYVYDRWVSSINDDEGLAIIGTPNGSRAIPLWDLLDNSGSSTLIKSYLIRAYADLCGEKYGDYLEKYPALSRTIGESENPTGAITINGHSLSFNNNTSYFSYEDASVVEYDVFRDSIIFMDYADTNPEIKKEWKIVNGSEYVEILDENTGIFQVKSTATNGKDFIVGIYDKNSNTLISTKSFTIKDDVFSGGTGTEENPYLIATKDDFAFLRRESSYWGKNFKLVNSLDFENEEVTCIGSESNPFAGTFDGGNCYLKNFKILTPLNASLGLFAYNTGTIKNLFIENETVGKIKINEDDEISYDVPIKYAGGLVGHNKGSIVNCKLKNVTIYIRYDVSEDYAFSIGGLIGLTNIATESTHKIEKIGIDGISIKGTLNNAETQKTEQSNVGGLIGEAQTNVNISNVYLKSIAQINATTAGNHCISFAGGLIGLNNAKGNIQYVAIDKINSLVATHQSYSREIEQHTFIGKNNNSEIKIEFSYVVEDSDGTGVTSDGLTVQNAITFTSADKLSSSIWCAGENEFPVLKCQEFNSSTALQVVSGTGKREFYYGQPFNIAGLKVEVQVASGGDPFAVDTFTYDESRYDATTLGTHHTIVINAMGFQTSYNVTVRKINVVGLIITPLKSSYFVGEKPTIDSYSVKYILENGDVVSPYDEQLSYVNYPTKAIELTAEEYVLGDNEIVATCGDITAFVIVKAEEKTVTEIVVTKQPDKIVYYEGKKFSPTGMEVQATYSDGSTEIINNKDLEIIMGDVVTLGENTVIVSYADYKTATLTITGEAIPVVYYTIVFKDYDGTIISEELYEAGMEIVVPTNPTREADNTYTYTFAGWDSEIESVVSADKTYKATYTSTYIEYTIKFVNYNDTELSSKTYHYGETVEVPANPTREADNTYAYAFAGWDSEITEVKGNKTYKATYTESYIEYTITFFNYDNTIIFTKNYHYGDIIEYPSTPTRENDSEYKYTFASWSETATIVTGNLNIIAQFNKEKISDSNNNQSNSSNQSNNTVLYIAIGALSSVIVLGAAAGGGFLIYQKKKNKKVVKNENTDKN